MATSSKVALGPTNVGEFHTAGITAASAAKASELLQENHEKHHILYSEDNFHNHIAHHMLSLYALGVPPALLEKHYKNNAGNKRPVKPVEKPIVEDMENPEHFKKYLGDQRYYSDFLALYQKEIAATSCEATVHKYLFAGDERAEDLFLRLYMGFLHPFIHLGFGIEFKQPAIVAEALAQASIHDDWLELFFYAAEKVTGGMASDKTLVELLHEIRADKELSTAARWSDPNKVRDGIIARALERMIGFASQFTVAPDQLEKKAAEIVNAAAYYTGGAQNPAKEVKIDFYFMHCVNSSIFLSNIIKQSWMKDTTKARILEWHGRMTLAMYASRRCPEILVDEIKNYVPKHPSEGGDPWGGIFARVSRFEDDGHAVKLIRALAHGEEVCRPYEGEKGFEVSGDMWLKLGHMAIDSVEGSKTNWARSVGFAEAWEQFADRTPSARHNL